VIPEKMLLPLTKDGEYGSIMTSVGLKVYDILANVEGEDRRKMLTKEETLKKEPLLNEETLLGGGFYSEYRTDDARLTIELLKKAAIYGATVINYCEMTDFIYSKKNKVKGLICLDHNTGKKITITSRRVVSAAGPWVDKLRKKDGPLNNKHLFLTKGVHVVFPKEKLPVRQSIYFDAPDGRMLFAIPRGNITYVGTTDTSYNGSLNRVVSTKADCSYILDAVNATFKSCNLAAVDIQSSWAGLRPLIYEDDASPSELSRKDEIFISKTGLISIAGGKLTGYRKMAQRVNAKVLSTMKKKHKEHITGSITRTIPLTTPAFLSVTDVEEFKMVLAKKILDLGFTDTTIVDYLSATYGKQAEKILDKVPSFNNVKIEEQLLLAELWYSIYFEMTNSLTDFFVRRTGRLFFDIDSVQRHKLSVLEYCKITLNWNEKRAIQEMEQLNMQILDATTFYEKEVKI
jgi:glycerol-3-phosphate dehydrogenase